MKKDWTDIIGEELESIREPLPADDWKVLQQKYLTSRRRKRHAAFAWAGGAVSAAVIVVIALLLAQPVAPAPQENLVAESFPVEEIVQQFHTPDKYSSTNEERDNSPKDIVSSMENVSSSAEGVNSSENDVSNADSASPEGNIAPYVPSDAAKEEESEMAESAWDLEQLPEDKSDKVPERRRNPISIGVTGAVSEEFAFASAYREGYAPPINNIPADTLVQEKHMLYTMSRGNSEYYDLYDHEIPVSVGVSARYFLSGRFAINTGLIYTRYTSTRNRYLLWTGKKISTDKQNVHYLGVPVRLDLMIVNRKHFNLYLGGGINIDKCIYASVGKERLREKEVILSSIFTAGFQVNVVPSFGLYFEPYVTRILMEGTLPTGREELMISAQGGLRFNF